jgi:integrase
MFRFAVLRHPEHAALIARVLAIPPKRTDRPLVTFLTDPEVDALLAAPDRSRWIGRRDHALLLVVIQTGLRVSELIGLRARDVSLGRGPHLRCQGKSRKERAPPAHPPNRRRAARLDRRTAVRARRSAISRKPRRPPEPQRRRAAAHQARPKRPALLPKSRGQAALAAHAAPYQRDAAAAGRRRHDRNRPLARA